MGSWSESCGFSGLEIREQETCYVMLLEGPKNYESHGPYNTFAPLTTLLKGSYDDYGHLGVDDDEEILKLFNLQSGLTLANGDIFSLDMLDGRAVSRFWIHGSVFDRLGEIKQEFPYYFENGQSVKVKNLGETLERANAEKLRNFNACAATLSALKKEAEEDGSEKAQYHRDLQMELAIMRLDRHSSSFSMLPVMKFYNAHRETLLTEGGDTKAFFEAQQRNILLEWAANELRKKIVPSEGSGPQHSGEVASVQFAQMIIDIQKDRCPESDDD